MKKKTIIKQAQGQKIYYLLAIQRMVNMAKAYNMNWHIHYCMSKMSFPYLDRNGPDFLYKMYLTVVTHFI